MLEQQAKWSFANNWIPTMYIRLNSYNLALPIAWWCAGKWFQQD
jgi:hypothetical protein